MLESHFTLPGSVGGVHPGSSPHLGFHVTDKQFVTKERPHGETSSNLLCERPGPVAPSAHSRMCRDDARGHGRAPWGAGCGTGDGLRGPDPTRGRCGPFEGTLRMLSGLRRRPAVRMGRSPRHGCSHEESPPPSTVPRCTRPSGPLGSD